jgi:hypothetical protein
MAAAIRWQSRRRGSPRRRRRGGAAMSGGTCRARASWPELVGVVVGVGVGVVVVVRRSPRLGLRWRGQAAAVAPSKWHRAVHLPEAPCREPYSGHPVPPAGASLARDARGFTVRAARPVPRLYGSGALAAAGCTVQVRLLGPAPTGDADLRRHPAARPPQGRASSDFDRRDVPVRAPSGNSAWYRSWFTAPAARDVLFGQAGERVGQAKRPARVAQLGGVEP